MTQQEIKVGTRVRYIGRHLPERVGQFATVTGLGGFNPSDLQIWFDDGETWYVAESSVEQINV